ncbi:MAG: amidohydrolase [uncultured archaeon A07HR60]|nr:MAG: amidohydrolase [uncultured archaeon A07HR60]
MSTIGSQSLTELRRDFHRHPETGWTEYRTTALVAEELDRLGYDIHLGADAVDISSRLGVPDADLLSHARERAREEGAPEPYLQEIDKTTGLVAELAVGEGPTVGIRVDMDALEITENTNSSHRPAAEDFASCHPGEMHACGHDGHTAIGVGIARRLAEIAETGALAGEVRLFFQPAEEGGRGGWPMSRTDHLTDIDQFIALHLGLGNETGEVIAGYDRPLSNAKMDVTFTGDPAHAGKEPHTGRNAVQAAAAAIQNLYAIPRHGTGPTRINVGQLHSPNAQNVIADHAELRFEVRGGTAELNDYMREAAERVVRHAGGMHDVDVETELYGKTTSFEADPALVRTVTGAADSVGAVDAPIDRRQMGASEDASYLIERVQREGGEATYIGIGADNPSGHHTSRFDIDEDALKIGVDVVVETVRRLTGGY